MSAGQWPWERLISRKVLPPVGAVCAVTAGPAITPESREGGRVPR